jgi:cardiolipin synthase
MISMRLSLISNICYRQLNSKLLFRKNSNKSNRLLATTKQNNKINNNQNETTKRFQSQTNKNDEKEEISLASRVHTIPNYITMGRILSVPFINYFVLINEHEMACSLFLLASITDFVDGYIARNWPNQKSSLGSILDPLADKLLIGSLTVTLALTNMLPIELAVVILSRDFVLILASLVLRYKLIDEPKTFKKYINVQRYSTVQVEADSISKFNTFLQLSLITLTLPSILFDYNESVWLMALQYLTGTTTVLSSISYLYKRGSYKLIKKSKQTNN